MAQENEGGHERRSSEQAAAWLEAVIPIAVVIGAGCAPCARTAVDRALRSGCARSLIARTLKIVAHLRSRECFVQAVDPEVVARLERSLEAGEEALRGAALHAKGESCCA